MAATAARGTEMSGPPFKVPAGKSAALDAAAESAASSMNPLK
jgi:hypothetical protein